MKPLKILGRILWADFLERTRRYSFIITLGMMVFLGFSAIPHPESGILTVDLGGIRGVYNSAWIGCVSALLGTMIFSLPGFYLVKNGISRDAATGVGQIIATTPLKKTAYILGKGFSNFLYLVSVVMVFAIAAGLTQYIRAEVLTFDLWDLAAPFLFITLPMLTLVSACAVLFESIPVLRGGFGNIVYLAVYLVSIAISLSSVTFSSQGVIENPINDLFGTTLIGASMGQAAQAAFPDNQLDFGVGYTQTKAPIETFTWEGIHWNAEIVLERTLWVGAAVGITLLAALFFDRFDPARSKPLSKRKNRDLKGLNRWLQGMKLPGLDLFCSIGLPRLTLHSPFGRVLRAELKMMLKGLRWWWYLVAFGLIIGGLSAADFEAKRGFLLAAWIWPVLLWSKLGTREKKYHTEQVVFSTPRLLWRQLPAALLAGILLAMLTGSGVGLSLLLVGDWTHLLTWGLAAIFIPSLALALGVWTSSKCFEALYVAWWYIGPVSGVAVLDFVGFSNDLPLVEYQLIFLSAIVFLLLLAFWGRAIQIKK